MTAAQLLIQKITLSIFLTKKIVAAFTNAVMEKPTISGVQLDFTGIQEMSQTSQLATGPETQIVEIDQSQIPQNLKAKNAQLLILLIMLYTSKTRKIVELSTFVAMEMLFILIVQMI